MAERREPAGRTPGRSQAGPRPLGGLADVPVGRGAVISLLDFAIAASVTVVPIMLGMLWLVAVLRPADAPTAGAAVDRYVSVRHVAALKTFEQAVVRRGDAPRAAPTADEVLAAMPRCRAEWAPKWTLATLWGREPAPSQATRIAAQLAELDLALLRFGARPNARVAGTVGLQPARWFEAADAALASSFDTPDYPGMTFQVRCADLSAALTALTRADARMLDALAWRGTETGAVVARWQPQQMLEISAGQVARRNPWNGVPGCVYLGAHFVAAAGSAEERVCALPAMHARTASAPAPSALRGTPGPDIGIDDSRWSVPPSLQTMLQPLDTLRRPTGSLYRLHTDAPATPAEAPNGQRHGPNRIVLDGAPVDVGFSIDITIDPTLQALAQKTAACYTGRQDVCRATGIRRAEDRDEPLGQRLLEGAMVRMAAVAIIDVESGRIEALAGALSPCARQEVDGPGRGTGCDKRLPYPVQYRPDALLNPAVFHDAMPASTVKPIMAAAFLADPEVGARWLATERAGMKPGAPPARDSLRGQLMRSDSARFLDRMFCSDKNFAGCKRPWDLQTTAAAFGWNNRCDPARMACGKQDLLFGRSFDTGAPSDTAPSLALPVAYGRLLSEPVGARLGAALKLMPSANLNADIVRRCALGVDGRRGGDDDWEKCKGGAVVDVVAEGWGQGHARSSALGVAGMMRMLAAAANGQAQLQPPHLVQGVRGARPGDTALQATLARFGPADAQPNRLPRDAAEVILSGLSYSHRNGSARTACEQVFDAATCRGVDWIAGKTGTPSFPNDGRSLDELARLCGQSAIPRRSDDPACSSMRPYKWYVAAYRPAKGSGPWTKAIGVLTERNWNRKSGQVHGAGDHGPNPAAEIALQIVGRQAGVIPGALP